MDPMVKHSFMLQLWRFQQSQALLGLLLWSLLLTVTSFDVLKPVLLGFLNRQFGIPPDAPGAVFISLLIIFVAIVSSLFIFGYIYDNYLRLWREQSDVAIDRNPYTRERLTAKEILTWRNMFLPALRSAAASRGSDGPSSANDPDVESHIAFMENWIQRSLEDSRTRRAVEETREWVEPKV